MSWLCSMCPMSVGHRSTAATATPVAVEAGLSFALLVALAGACRGPREELTPELREALAAVGDAEGEVWLNLLGIPLDAGQPQSVDHLLGAVDTMDPVELRLHLLGRHAWSWCTLAGIDDIEAAARGEADASARLLAHPRYYGGHARASLGVLLGLDPMETRGRIADAIAAGSRSLLDPSAAAELAEAAAAARSALGAQSSATAIERLTSGYRYVAEPEAERVVLIPHLEPGLPLVLAQHRFSRLVAYYADARRLGGGTTRRPGPGARRSEAGRDPRARRSRHGARRRPGRGNPAHTLDRAPPPGATA